MAKRNGTTRATGASSTSSASQSSAMRTINSLREGEVYSGRGNNNEYVEYEITRNSLTGEYSLVSHEFLTDSYGNASGRTTDIQETAPSLNELKKKIKENGYIIG